MSVQTLICFVATTRQQFISVVGFRIAKQGFYAALHSDEVSQGVCRKSIFQSENPERRKDLFSTSFSPPVTVLIHPWLLIQTSASPPTGA